MTRSELIIRIYNNFPTLIQKDADIAVRTIIDEMENSLINGKRIEIRGFGSFKVIFRKSRSARNPRTGEEVRVAPKFVPQFRASKILHQRISSKVPKIDIRQNSN